MGSYRRLPFCSMLIFIGLTVFPLHAQKQRQPVPLQPPPSAASQSDAAKPTRITPEQAKQLFRSVDAILKFDSRATGLPIRHSVKRRLVTRDEVTQYLTQQLHNDRAAQRLERSELVLKKFGLLDRDFQLKPFLITLLREQIAGYYDDKTKTVNLLDWIPPDDQKPVLAHELTHALQDQHIHLKTWDRQSDISIAKNVKQDNRHIATDEADTARDAVAEGQAMAVFIDYALAPTGKSLLNEPGLADRLNDAMNNSADSPALANAPLVLQRSLIFPYDEGLRFVRSVLAARGKKAAFTGLLNHPPSSTYEVMTPQVYLDRKPVPLLRMPDIHPLIDPQYNPYDVGVMGEFDVQIMAELFGGPAAAKSLAPAWRGGIYYIAQARTAKEQRQQNSTSSLALLYLSRWATPEAARAFAATYAREVPRKYDHAEPQPGGDGPDMEGSPTSQIWNTSEGPVLIVVSGRTVFISESFPMPLARKLQFVMMGSIVEGAGSVLVQNGPMQLNPGQPKTHREELTAELRHWFMASGALPVLPPTTGKRAKLRKLSGCPGHSMLKHCR